MHDVQIDQLRVGDVVAGDVRDVSGKVLVRKGLVLTARHLRALRMWGTATVAIDGEDQSAPAPAVTISPAEEAQARAALERRFRLAPVTHPAMARLFDISLKRQFLAWHTEAGHHEI